MKSLLASIAALSLVASPALAAQKSSSSTKTVTTKSGNTKATTTVSTKGNTTTAKTTVKPRMARSHKKARRHHEVASKSIATQAKAEKESAATEAKEHRAAATHHRLSQKAAMKSSKTTKG